MNVLAVSTSLQHRFLVPNEHGVNFPVQEGMMSILTLLFFIRAPLIASFRFFFS